MRRREHTRSVTPRPPTHRRGRACPVPHRRSARLLARALAGILAGAALAGCTIHPPARLGASPGGYEAFVREVMAEAARTAAPKPAGPAAQTAAEHLGGGGESSPSLGG